MSRPRILLPAAVAVEVYAAKRPATINWPAPGRVNPNTPIVWRPVSTVSVAN